MAIHINTLQKRLLYSAIIVTVIYLAIFRAPFGFYLALNSVLIGIGLFEFYTMLEAKGFKPNKYIGIGFGVVFPLFIYFPGEALVFAAAILVLLFLNFDPAGKQSGFMKTAVTMFGLVYVALFMSYFTKLRFTVEGVKWVGYVIWVTKMGDAGAYFVGTTFGTVRPLPRISPNKTVEGAIGGMIVSLLVSMVFKLYIPSVPFVHFIVLGICTSILGQIGDLSESLIKRECNVKDSGVIPGLGGMLDIIDSLLFSVPFVYYYVNALLY